MVPLLTDGEKKACCESHTRPSIAYQANQENRGTMTWKQREEGTYLKQVAIFADLAEEDIRDLMAAAKRRTFRAGEVIFHRDDPGQVLYMIKEGKVKICLISPDGQEISLAVLGAGEYFGEFALYDGLPRSADAIAHRKS